MDSTQSCLSSPKISVRLLCMCTTSSPQLVTGSATSLPLSTMFSMNSSMVHFSANTPDTPSISSTGYLNSSTSSTSETRTETAKDCLMNPIYILWKLLSIKYIIYEPKSLLSKPLRFDLFHLDSIKLLEENKNWGQEINIK